ncbi:MAG: hypothetical protein Kow006_10570 [Gammaproteobacteria bacterium]
MEPGKRKLAPEVFRQRLLVEGYYGVEVTEASLREFLLGLAAHLALRTYGDPVIFSPASGMGREENAGFDAFVPLIDSGISAYVWSRARFASILIYTCKGFNEKEAERFCCETLRLQDGYLTQAF